MQGRAVSFECEAVSLGGCGEFLRCILSWGRQIRQKALTVGAIAAVFAAFVTIPTFGDSTVILLYGGDSSSVGPGMIVPQGALDLLGWGAGASEKAQFPAYSGRDSLKISTEGYYEGARIDLPEPIDLSQLILDPQKAFLSIRIAEGKGKAPPPPVEAQTTPAQRTSFGGPFMGPTAVGGPAAAEMTTRAAVGAATQGFMPQTFTPQGAFPGGGQPGVPSGVPAAPGSVSSAPSGAAAGEPSWMGARRLVEQMSAQPGTQIPPMAMARATGRFSDERLNSARGQRRLMRTVARMQGSSANITAGPEQPSGTAAPAASAGTPFGPGGGGFPGMMGGMGMGASMMGEGMPPMMGQMGGQGGGPPWQSTGATAGGAAGPALPSAGQPRAAKPEEAPPVPPGAVRVVLVTDKGELASGSLAMGEGVQEARGWVRIDVPLGELKGDASALKGKVERIIITGDRPGDFYLGQVAIVVEDSPLDFEVSLNVGPDGVAKVGEALSGEVKMIGPVGPNEVRCSWDFDDRDGVGGDLSHRKVRFQYSEPGEYVVTVTVADIVGRHGVARKQVKLVAEGEEGSPE